MLALLLVQSALCIEDAGRGRRWLSGRGPRSPPGKPAAELTAETATKGRAAATVQEVVAFGCLNVVAAVGLIAWIASLPKSCSDEYALISAVQCGQGCFACEYPWVYPVCCAVTLKHITPLLLIFGVATCLAFAVLSAEWVAAAVKIRRHDRRLEEAMHSIPF